MSASYTNASIRVMTYNIHRWAGPDERLNVIRLAHVIRAAGADAVGLNEVLHPVTVDGHAYEPLVELAQRLEMEFTFGPSGWVDYGPGWHGPAGNALLSRYPFKDVANIMLPRPPGTKQRSLLGAALAAGPAQGLMAFVTHLDHAFEGTRLLQIQAVLRYISGYGPHYLGGDLNTPGFVGKHTHRLLPPVLRLVRRAGYKDAFHAVGHGHGRTFPSISPIFRLDFLFIPAQWAGGLRSANALSSGVVRYASDHRPVVAEWSWPFSSLRASA